MELENWVPWLPHLNASLNGLATALLLVGYWSIRRGRVPAHRRAMLAAFATSVVFLVSYLVYHSQVVSRPFPAYPPQAVRYFYYGVLLSHVLLAMLVPVLAIVTITLAWRDRIVAHRRWARITFPIWLYVSVTGVVVYAMLYQIYPS